MSSLIQHHHLSTSFSSSTSSFIAKTNFTLSTHNVSLPAAKNSGICKCVSTPAAEKTAKNTTRLPDLAALNTTDLFDEFYEAYKTTVSRNENLGKLQAGYLFPEVARRRAAHMLKYPDAQVISLGIGDTTEPIPEVITSAMAKRAHELSTLEGYSGYGAEQGEKQVRAAIAKTFYADLDIDESDIFVFDGAKCDISRLQVVFGSTVTMAVQDPSYPAYVDSSVIMGQTGQFQKDIEQFAKIEYMKCTPADGFFPYLSRISRTDKIFFCSPNNPTGSAPSREQLTRLVQFAKDNGSIIVYDSAYAMYMSDDNPRSIFEIPGAKEVAIETSSFSKYAGFTGVRLGWTDVPKELLFSDGFPVAKDFNRIVCTCFNGASNIAQAGGLACLSPEGLKAMLDVTGFNKNNIKIPVGMPEFSSNYFSISRGKKALGRLGDPKSWDAYGEWAGQTHIATTGSALGPPGEVLGRYHFVVGFQCHWWVWITTVLLILGNKVFEKWASTGVASGPKDKPIS